LKKIDVGQTIGILANLGVVAGILFLVVEIQQNTETLQAEMRFNQSERTTDAVEQFVSNPQLVSAYVKFERGDSLSREEDIVLSFYARRVLTSWRWVYGEVQRGTLDETALSDFRRLFHTYPLGTQPLLAHYWDDYTSGGGRNDFIQWIEENVINER